jgi:hypothetical protein
VKKLALVPVLVCAALLALAAGGASSAGAATATAAACPSFRVLHNDRIGAAMLPAGNYTVVPTPTASLTCTAASHYFTRFLADYDGVLPRPWTVIAQGTGKASFKLADVVAFSVSRSSGDEEGSSSLGVLCSGNFSVEASTQVGPLYFPKGGYLLYIPQRSAMPCRRASTLFTRFLDAGGKLPQPWRTITQTATFYKPAHPQRSALRVEPLAGATGAVRVPN